MSNAPIKKRGEGMAKIIALGNLHPFLVKLLSRKGHEIICVESIEEMIDKADELKPQLLSVKEPPPDFLTSDTTWGRLQTEPKTREIPVVLFDRHRMIYICPNCCHRHEFTQTPEMLTQMYNLIRNAQKKEGGDG